MAPATNVGWVKPFGATQHRGLRTCALSRGATLRVHAMLRIDIRSDLNPAYAGDAPGSAVARNAAMAGRSASDAPFQPPSALRLRNGL